MKSIGEVTSELISSSPFVEEALSDGLINISSLARKLKPEIEVQLGKPIKEGAIIMAISRLSNGSKSKVEETIIKYISELGDVIVRSNLSDYTYANSSTLVDSQRELLNYVNVENQLFCTFSQGVYETTIVVSSSIDDKINQIFRGEKLLSSKNKMSSITIRLPKGNSEIPGIYYFILKKIAWSGIAVNEVISTTNEMTLVVEGENVDKTFSVLMNLKKS